MASLGPIVSVPVNWSLDWCDFDDDKTVVPAWAAWHWQRVEKKRERSSLCRFAAAISHTKCSVFFCRQKKEKEKKKEPKKSERAGLIRVDFCPAVVGPQSIASLKERMTACLLACRPWWWIRASELGATLADAISATPAQQQPSPPHYWLSVANQLAHRH